VCLSSVSFCLNVPCLVLMRLDMRDMGAGGYEVMERILNICINYANDVSGPTKHGTAILAERL